MASDKLMVSKSKVSYDEDNKVTKEYKRVVGSSRDPLLYISSSNKPPIHYFRKERSLLEVFNDVEGSLLPKLYSWDNGITPYGKGKKGRSPSITIECIKGPTFLDLINSAIVDYHNSGKSSNLNSIISEIPVKIATLHKQMSAYHSELRNDLVWYPGRSMRSGLKLRSVDEEKGRQWNYWRAITYTMCDDPFMRNLRSKVRRKKGNQKQNTGAANRDIKKFWARLGLDTLKLKQSSVDHLFTILYGGIHNNLIKNPTKSKSIIEGFIKDGVLMPIHGDLGPQHLFANGRVIDFDEARLGSGVEDLVAGLYNMHTFPTDDGVFSESHLLKISRKYLEAMLERNPTEEEELDFYTKIGAAQLRSLDRIFAADCRAPVAQLRQFVTGNPDYLDVPDNQLRHKILTNIFSNRYRRFLDDWGNGPVWQTILRNYSPAYILQEEIFQREKQWSRLGVFKSLEDPSVIDELEKLISS